MEFFEILAEFRRSRRLIPELIATIEREGGDVLEYRPISRVVPSPFEGFRVYPNLYEFRVRYAVRRGRWYIRTSGDRCFPDWVWADDDGDLSPIVERNHLIAAPNVRAVSWLTDWLLIGSMILAGLLAVISIYLAFF